MLALHRQAAQLPQFAEQQQGIGAVQHELRPGSKVDAPTPA